MSLTSKTVITVPAAVLTPKYVTCSSPMAHAGAASFRIVSVAGLGEDAAPAAVTERATSTRTVQATSRILRMIISRQPDSSHLLAGKLPLRGKLAYGAPGFDNDRQIADGIRPTPPF
jgi:hypothetical protein